MKSPASMPAFTAAIIQHAPVFLNLEESVRKACSLVEQAASKGANVIAFPRPGCPAIPPGWISPPGPPYGTMHWQAARCRTP